MSVRDGYVLTFGEVLLRLSPPGRERLLQSPQLHTWWGGAESNVAVALAHLGTPSRHVTVLPHEALGDAAVAALVADGVDTAAVQRRPGRMGLYFVEPGTDDRPLRVVYDRAQSAFAQQDDGTFDWPALLADARWLHVTGISAALGDGPLRAMHAALDAAAALGVPVSLDLNFRPALWAHRDPGPVMQPLVRKATLLIGNPGAVAVMLGIVTAGTAPEAPAAIAATITALHDTFGTPRIAITQREVVSPSRHVWQAHYWDASAGVIEYGGRYAMPVVDRAGGGDAFAAGLVHALLAGSTAAHAVRFATAAGALKLSVPGDRLRASAHDVTALLDAAG